MRKQADLGAGDAARASARADEGENSSVTGLTHGDVAQSNEGPDRAREMATSIGQPQSPKARSMSRVRKPFKSILPRLLEQRLNTMHPFIMDNLWAGKDDSRAPEIQLRTLDPRNTPTIALRI